MARIRTVKPELWTDPDFTECSVNARLLFIALLNFASDYGVLPDKPRQLKMQCLPADTVDVDPLIDELIAANFLVRCDAPNGDKVLVIRTFTEHQKINRATKGRWGDPAEWSGGSVDGPPTDNPDSNTPHGGLSEPHPPEGKGREGKGTGKEGKGREPSSSQHNSHQSDPRTTTTETKDHRFETVTTLIADHNIKQHGAPNRANPDRHRQACINNLIRQHGQRINQYLTDRPDITPQLAANALALELER